MSAKEINYTAETRTARKPRQCEDYPSCTHVIQLGEEYSRHVAFPGHDANSDGSRPWVLHLCRACTTRYDRPMPPRRKRRQS